MWAVLTALPSYYRADTWDKVKKEEWKVVKNIAASNCKVAIYCIVGPAAQVNV